MFVSFLLILVLILSIQERLVVEMCIRISGIIRTQFKKKLEVLLFFSPSF